MQHDPDRNELRCKLVWCGPGMAGKSTNIAAIIAARPPGTATGPEAIDLHSERTLKAEFVAVELAMPGRPPVVIEMWTVPGQSFYAATRRAVLQEADAVVFVADCRREAMDENIDALNEMHANRRQLALPDDLPVVIQYNKQDLPTAVPPAQLEPLMNGRGWPAIPAVASTGKGVPETLKAILDLVRVRLPKIDLGPQPLPLPSAAKPEAPRTWLISCHRCATMLEVPDARPGAVYTCGSCQATLEVVDGERGLTRQPPPKSTLAVSRPPSLPRQPSMQPAVPRATAVRDDSSGGYALQSANEGSPSGSPLMAVGTASRDGTASRAGSAAFQGSAYELDGWEALGFLDESPLGRRTRVRDPQGKVQRGFSISPTVLTQSTYREQLDPFVRLAGPVRHPNLLPLNAFYPLANGGAVLVSQDIPETEPLVRVLARRRVLAPPHAVHVLRQLALALEEAARFGVTHGWVRPECILASGDGTLFLDDLCLPKPHRFLVRELGGASAATEYYLAPEHLNDDSRSDLRSDIFLLGVLMYRMITGEGLITGYNPHEALHKIIANGARPLRASNAPVSRELDNFYKRLTAIDRKDRFQTYREVIDQLDRFGGGARRQTLRLTQNVTAGNTPLGGQPILPNRKPTGQYERRETTGAQSRLPTGSFSREPSGSPAPRREPSGGHYRPHQPHGPANASIRQRRQSGAGPVIAVAVVVVAVAAAAVAVAFMPRPAPQQPQQRQNPPAAVDPGPNQASATAAAAAPAQPAEAVTVVKPAEAVTVVKPAEPAPAAEATRPAEPAQQNPSQQNPNQQNPVAKPVEPAPSGAPTEAQAAPTMATPAQLEEIATALVSERYATASALVEKLPDSPVKHMRQITVRNAYQGRKAQAETIATTSNNLTKIRETLDRAANNWGMPGDKEWAMARLAAAELRLANQPVESAPAPTPVAPAPQPATKPATPAPATPAPSAPAPVPPPAPPPEAPAQPSPARQAFLIAVRGINAGRPNAASEAAGPLGADSPDGKALIRLGTLARGAVGVLQRAIAGKAQLRLLHPLTREECDVTGATDQGLELTSAAGGSSQVAWATLSDKAAVGALYADAIKAPGTTVDDRAVAAAMLAASGHSAFATLALRPARATLPPDLLADLDRLIALAAEKP